MPSAPWAVASANYTAGGRKIQVITEDEEQTAEAAMRKARKLIESDKVHLLTGVVNTSAAYALRDLVHEAKVSFVCALAGGNDLTRKKRSPYVRRSSFTSWQLSYPLGQWAAENVGKKAYIIAADYAFGHESADAFSENFTKHGGQIVGDRQAVREAPADL